MVCLFGFLPPCTRNEFFLFFFFVSGHILFSFRLLIHRRFASRPASHGQARARQLSNPSQVNHGSPPACRWRYLWLFFTLALLSFMPTYQHVGRPFGGFDTSVVQIDGVLSRQSTLAYAALHHIILSTLPTAYHSPYMRLQTSPHAPSATVHARRQLRPMLPSAAG